MNNLSYQKLQEIAVSKGKTLFVEDSTIRIDSSTIKLQEKSEIVEQNGKSHIVKGTITNIPITTYEFNKNNRRYQRPVWEGVQKSQRFDGSFCMDSHVEDGKVKDILGVWKNFKLGEKNAFGDLKLYGEDGAKVLALSEDTGLLGLSTVGMGETDDDGNVYPESYEYIRTDIVLEPSQEVYINIHKESKIEKEETEGNKIVEIKKSFLEKDTNFIKENSNNKSNLSEKKEDYKMDKMIESNVKSEARLLLGSISRNQNLFESYSQLSSFYKDIPEEMVDTKQEIRVAMSELKSKISEEVSQKDKKIAELEEKYEASCKVNDELKEKYNKACSLIDSENSLEEGISAKLDAFSKLEEAKKESDQVIAKMQENEKVMLADIAEFKESYEKFEEEKKVYEEEITAMKEDIDIFIPERDEMIDDIDKFKEEREAYLDDNKQLLAIIEENHIEIDHLRKQEDTKKKGSRFQERRTHFHVEPAIQSFYEKEVKVTPALEDIEDEILGSSSLIEAVNKVKTFLNESDETPVRTSGKKEKPYWLGSFE